MLFLDSFLPVQSVRTTEACVSVSEVAGGYDGVSQLTYHKGLSSSRSLSLSSLKVRYHRIFYLTHFLLQVSALHGVTARSLQSKSHHIETPFRTQSSASITERLDKRTVARTEVPGTIGGSYFSALLGGFLELSLQRCVIQFVRSLGHRRLQVG